MTPVPWWLLLYALLFLLVTIFWMRDEWRTERKISPIVVELGLDACLIAAAAAYWLPSFGAVLGVWLAPLCFLGFASVAAACAREFPALFKDPKDSLAMRLVMSLAAAAVVCVVYGPLVFWALSAALNSNQIQQAT